MNAHPIETCQTAQLGHGPLGGCRKIIHITHHQIDQLTILAIEAKEHPIKNRGGHIPGL